MMVDTIFLVVSDHCNSTMGKVRGRMDELVQGRRTKGEEMYGEIGRTGKIQGRRFGKLWWHGEKSLGESGCVTRKGWEWWLGENSGEG